MVFSDLFFLFVFIPIFVLLYLLAGWIEKQIVGKFIGQNNSLKNIVLVVFSLLFYAWGEPIYLFLLLICVLVNYIVGRFIDIGNNYKKVILVVGILSNVGILVVFKYLNFIVEILQSFGLNVNCPDILLPIGISFYIFQSISYLVDVYRGISPVQKSFWGLLLYISMFPQLIAGPIVRYSTIAHEINERKVSVKDISDGIYRFIIGLAKKVIIANQLGEIVALLLQDEFSNISFLGVWLGVVAFTLQLYFDFSGYSDMAIGIGRCLGFHFCENFNHPYCSKSITEFWRRWHISLGTFFRDYVYIPLGGNRNHQLINILIVWFLTGLWHGASWNFVLWGIYFGVFVLTEKYTLLKIIDRVPNIILHIYTLIIVIFGMGIFYFEDSVQLWLYISKAFNMNNIPFSDFVTCSVLSGKFWLWVVAILFSIPIRSKVDALAMNILQHRICTYNLICTFGRIVITCIILIVCVSLLVGATNNAFLYTRF